MKKQRILLLLALAALIVAVLPTVAAADPFISPDEVVELVYPGESVDIAKAVGTPELPPKVDVCLLEDETGSFRDDINNLQNPVTIAAIFNGVRAGSPDSQFAVAGFRDYARSPYGGSGDWVYRLRSSMSASFADWENGVNALTAGGGGDPPEAQYDAIVGAVDGPTDYAPDSVGSQEDCGWRVDANVTRVLVVATDARFHTPDGTHQNSQATTIAALQAEDVTLIGLKAGAAGGELDALAAATGGSVQPLSSDGSNIADAILAGLGNLPIDVALVSDCAAPISTSFVPAIDTVTSGDDASFTETIGVDAGAAGGTYACEDQVTYDSQPEEGLVESKTIHVPGITLEPETDTNELTAGAEHTVTATVTAGDYGPVADVPVEFAITAGPNVGLAGSETTDSSGNATFPWMPGAISSAYLGVDTVVASFTDGGTVVYGSDTAAKEWVDTTPPIAACLEGPNPGGKVPQAPGSGQNEDGFYLLDGSDEVWADEDLLFFVVDTGSGTVFGPYPKGTTIKYTEAGKVKDPKPIGGPNSAVDWHITGTGDAQLLVIDGSDNEATSSCLVPPPPK